MIKNNGLEENLEVTNIINKSIYCFIKRFVCLYLPLIAIFLMLGFGMSYASLILIVTGALVLSILFFMMLLQFMKKLCSRSQLIMNFISIVNMEIKFISMVVGKLINNLYKLCIKPIQSFIEILFKTWWPFLLDLIFLLCWLLVVCGGIYFLCYYPLQFIGVVLLLGLIFKN